jgi:hypothetical protein
MLESLNSGTFLPDYGNSTNRSTELIIFWTKTGAYKGEFFEMNSAISSRF